MADGLPIHVDDVPPHRWEYGEIGATRRRLGIAAGAKRRDLIPGDVCVYPEKRTFKPARGVELPY